MELQLTKRRLESSSVWKPQILYNSISNTGTHCLHSGVRAASVASVSTWNLPSVPISKDAINSLYIMLRVRVRRSGFNSRQRNCWDFFSSPPRPGRFWGPRSVLSNGYRGKRGRGVKLTTRLHLVPRLRMCGVIHPLPQYSFIAW
jgi:hypothetical protein